MHEGFFSYSSNPIHCGECIEKAIKKINHSGVTRIVSWKELKIGGKFIIEPILEGIDKADYFCADLTGINDNVFFELGYAIARDKPFWLIFDTSHLESARKFKELSMLVDVGYSSYSNSSHIIDAFYNNRPYESTYNVLNDSLKTISKQDFREPLLYLKGQIDTNYSQEIFNILVKNDVKFILDDAVENKTQPFGWYIERILSIPSVIAEFSSTTRSGFEIQNSKCSLISGLAHGLGLRVIMICEEPYEVPIDYTGLLKKYSKTEECNKIIYEFVKSLKSEFFDLINKKKRYIVTQKKRSDLQKINFGEFIAEHEIDELDNYYVETKAVTDFIGKNTNIVIGRKGVGKTAALYYLKNELKQEKENHICVIKPVTFELEGLIYLLETIPERFERSYLIEATWKFLIYTEIALSVYNNILSKPPYLVSESEFQFVDFIESNSEIFLEHISIRLEQQLQNITSKDFEGTISNFKIRVSEILHSEIIGELRDQLSVIFEENRRIIVLIDNLDKSWKKDSKLELQSRWILGLIGVTDRIIKDFTTGKISSKKYSFNLTIFLRSDIFKHVLNYSREPDKIGHTKLFINDPGILYRIIEERFVKLSEKDAYPEDLWDKYICKEVEGIKVKQYIYDKIIPRPRDIIYFFIKSKESAVLKGHTKINKDDIKYAYSEYSSWVFKSILVENGITITQMENFMYELLGTNRVFDRDTLIDKMRKSKLPASEGEEIEYFIDHLSELAIIGKEVIESKFEFDYDLEKSNKIKYMAKKFNSNRFMIHNSLYPYLEIE